MGPTDELLRHGDFVRRLARSLVGNADLAEDIAQETWLAALRRPPRYADNVRGWLAAVVRNLARLQRRTDVRRLARERFEARALDAVDPSSAVARLEAEQRIVAAVQGLEEPYRTTVVHRFLEQMDPAEIASRMGVPRKTVYTRIDRALETLRRRMDREPGGRHAWCLALLPLALDRRTLAAAAAAPAAIPVAALAAVAGLVTVSFLAGRALPPEPHGVPREHVTTAYRATAIPTSVEAAPAAAAPVPVAPSTSFVSRVEAASPSWLGVMEIANQISRLPPDEGLAVMEAVFREVADPEKRRQMLKAFTLDDGHPRSLEIQHLGATDPDEGVREWALAYLSAFAFRDFRSDPALYGTWREGHRGRPLREIVRESAEDFVRRVRWLGGDDLRREFRAFETLELQSDADLGLPEVMKSAGLLDAATAWLDREPLSPGEREIVHGWIRALDPDEAFLRRVYLPALADPETPGDLLQAAALALGNERNRWAVEPLVGAYARVRTLGGYRAISRALLAIGDERAIPAMIAAIAADDTQSTIDGVGTSLADLAGTEYHPSHDAAWWLAWWERNRQRYPGLVLPAPAR